MDYQTALYLSHAIWAFAGLSIGFLAGVTLIRRRLAKEHPALAGTI